MNINCSLFQLNDTVEGREITRFCGNDFPEQPFYPRSLRVHFHTDVSSRFTGFKITAKAADAPADPCAGSGVVINDASGVIMSPNHPGNYANNLDCTWTVEHNVSSSSDTHFLFSHFVWEFTKSIHHRKYINRRKTLLESLAKYAVKGCTDFRSLSFLGTKKKFVFVCKTETVVKPIDLMIL